MKKIVLIFVLMLTITFTAGCSSIGDEENTAGEKNNKEGTHLSKYNGEWKLRVTGDDEELYLISSLEEYLGSTGIFIQEVDGDEVDGIIFSIQGAPSHRQAEVRFSGKIENGKLSTSYEDEAWGYAGNIELVFQDEMITAVITRDKVEPAPMWGIPEGEFIFIRPIETEKVKLTGGEKESLEEFLCPTIKDSIEPFAEGSLTDDSIISCIGLSMALGFIDHSEFGAKVTEGIEVQFGESVMNDLARKYFGEEVKEHKTVGFVTYGSGKYSVPALGGVAEYPHVQLLLKDTANKEIYYAVVDYIFEGPEGVPELEYQYLIKLQKTDGYIIKAIKKIEEPINFGVLIDSLSEDYIKNDLMTRSDLIPFEPVLGGTMGFHSKEDIKLLEDNKVLANFEDGHIGGRMTLKYEINDGDIEWTVLEAKLD